MVEKLSVTKWDKAYLGVMILSIAFFLSVYSFQGAKEAEKIVDSIHTETQMAEAVGEADFVLEGIIENLAVKQEFFAELDQHCPSHTILASGTSGLSPNEIVPGEQILPSVES